MNFSLIVCVCWTLFGLDAQKGTSWSLIRLDNLKFDFSFHHNIYTVDGLKAFIFVLTVLFNSL